ncbi:MULTISPECIES: geranylgeranylglyceryl/heptaprenylglyceryl phosphate synthase [unclassified Arcicella]|uniref:geranylgeranylglyceryl/heptaprenylglyceryl phosphate synthase n=1 Tax=unclassified Arcicella TaxID=2644986 RepID=UPI00285FA815|nr:MULTISPECIES: geranylgeranylglyceryl/heptaprenylglyceryl phosphate synthase [unclassified Arcicella]MDR6564124.1 putative glycerol-1-phosphate prenyltransferase [Arcicella sp. BE51]MDR6813877.1 putative glycerol-1-phosphate prenyltransferase [Arcicella sp. BE140]MDR6825189.1 putative glycerol-1-phosphate prenyltransferase [Arcicella sp. BE139]
MQRNLLNKFYELKAQGKKAFAVLIDPDKVNEDSFSHLISLSKEQAVDFFFVGGSLITSSIMEKVITDIKANSDIPVVLFPGNSLHLNNKVDGVLFLSLISGRNPDYLIGQQVISAPILKRSGIEVLPTGYMIIDSGRQTTVSYISNTTPIPHDKPSIAACTAMAGEMLGLKLIYMDAGSGAYNAVSPEMIAAVQQSVDVPIIVGGGINTAKKAHDALRAGADIIVVGNAIEERMELIQDIAKTVRSFNEVNLLA